MSASVLATIFLSVVAGVQSFTPILLDLRSIRVSPPHRKAGAPSWYSSNSIAQAFAGVAELALLWWPGIDLNLRFYVVAALTAISIVAGFVTLVGPEQFSEELNESGRYFRVPFGRGTMKFDVNIFLLPISAALLVVAVFLF